MAIKTKLSKSFLIVLLALYFLCVVIANAPARMLASIVHQNVPVLWLNDVDGTIWSGRAGSGQVDVSPFALPLGKVKWELSPWSLLFLSPCIKFEAVQPGQSLAGKMCHSALGTSKIKNVTVDGSMAIINSLAGTELKGRGSLDVQHGEFSRNQVNKLSAQLTWHNARIFVIDEWLSLGSYAAKIKENGKGGISADVFNMEAPLKLEMTANWLAADGWTADGTVVPGEGTPQKIMDGLSLFGSETEPGTYKFSWR